eukprot:14704-Chlamydomonas_euryale.AAC.1
MPQHLSSTCLPHLAPPTPAPPTSAPPRASPVSAAGVGPTNSGKTYSAVEALKAADVGVYCSPLRLLALE